MSKSIFEKISEEKQSRQIQFIIPSYLHTPRYKTKTASKMKEKIRIAGLPLSRPTKPSESHLGYHGHNGRSCLSDIPV